MDNCADAVCTGELESVTCTVIENAPLAEGVPVIWPVEEFRDKPVGSDPLVTDHVYGVVPPEAVRVAEYAAPSCASGKSPVKIVRDDPVAAIATVKDFAAVCTGELESFT